MQHALQISRKIEYGTRAMAFMASMPEGMTISFREIARKMAIPEEFLAKILKTLVKTELIRSTRGAHGGYSLTRSATRISFLDVIEAVEGPVGVNLCTEKDKEQLGCSLSGACTMHHVWREGQKRMLEVYRTTMLDTLAMRSLGSGHESPVLTALRASE